MKRLLIILASIGLIQQANAQSTIRLGIEGAYNSTWLFCKTVSDAGDELDYKSTFGSQIGISGVYSFQEGAGVYFGLLSGSVNQKYTNRYSPSSSSFETEVKLKYTDLPILFRLTAKGGFYFEVGPQFSFISKAEASSSQPGNSYTADVKDEVNSTNISAQIGFGVDVKASEKITIQAGLRFGYGLTDAEKEPAGTNNYEPTNSAVGGLHVGVAYNLGK